MNDIVEPQQISTLCASEEMKTYDIGTVSVKERLAALNKVKNRSLCGRTIELIEEGLINNKMNDIVEPQQISTLCASEEMKTYDIGTVSVKERLAALNKSSENWLSRVKKDEHLLLKRNSTLCQSIISTGHRNGKENEETSKIITITPTYKQSLMLNLDKGLDSFFLRTTTIDEIKTKNNDIDLNSIERTNILSTPKRPRLKKYIRGQSVITERLAALSANDVNIEEDPRDSLVTPVIFDEGGPIATSAQRGLQAVEDYALAKSALKHSDEKSPYPPLMLIRVADSPGEFLSLLGGGKPNFSLVRNTSEPFENVIARTNLILRVTDDYKLQSVAKGEHPRFGFLQAKETLIFDFGSEIYVWSGRNARKTPGRYAVEYAQQLKKKRVTSDSTLFGVELNDGRAPWILYLRVHQGVQNCLFAAKFSDWQTKELNIYGTPKPFQQPILQHYPDEKTHARLLADVILNMTHPKPSEVLEDQEITRDMENVVTENMKFWQLIGEELEPIHQTNIFVDNCCYVIRWQYRIQTTGVRRLRSGQLSEKETGRERMAFFYWLGAKTSPKQQGLCAVRLSYMDKEKHPHIRVTNSSESPLFLSLFQGKFIIRRSAQSAYRTFLVGGCSPAESYALEVDPAAALRSHAVYLRVHPRAIIVTAGSRTESVMVKIGLILAECVLASKHMFNLANSTQIRHEVEGDDKSIKWITAIGRTKTPRFYRIFDCRAEEILSAQYHQYCSFPIAQTALLDTVLVDVGEHLWIWSERTPTTFVLRVAEYFWKNRSGDVTVLGKSKEPNEFIAVFAAWENWTEVDYPQSEPRPLKELMAERIRTFDVEVLRARESLPEGIDRKNLLQYLKSEDFQRVFSISEDQFYKLPIWRQILLKKEAGLF
ncbi:villin headpiece domain protein [Dictyocaulus viviparus]|uniref:Villin headpiece domain protein n=1 Tax=Dictyocaulus viviparus TaxID=29172 RepID=A0A0D8YB57_DICVI|nr:villin headpiece domain protein [Dictyocaulus viviparus]